ncbi:MAG: hypothetical protein WBS20_17275 [Lysobacterales bacterium]
MYGLEVFARDTHVKFVLPGGKLFVLMLSVFFDTPIPAVWVNTEGIKDIGRTTANTIKLSPLPRLTGSRPFGKIFPCPSGTLRFGYGACNDLGQLN